MIADQKVAQYFGRQDASLSINRSSSKLRSAIRLAEECEPARAHHCKTGQSWQTQKSEIWLKLGALHQADAVLDDSGVALIRREVPAVDPQTGASLVPEEALATMLEHYQSAMAVDTVRNEYDLHRRLHEWFATNTSWTLEALNEQDYAELFLTPRSDTWLGLVAPGTYTGLEKGGRRE